MKIDPFTYALINNVDPMSGRPLKPLAFTSQMYEPNIAYGVPGSGKERRLLYGARPESNFEYVRAANQTAGEKYRRGLLSNILAGTVSKIGIGFGNVLGAIPALVSGDVTKIFDNGIVNAFEKVQEKAKEALPIHVGRQYQEGNFIAKMATPEFWANDGFDAVSFLIAAYAPGGFTKAVGMSKGAGKLFANILKKTTAEAAGDAFTVGFSTIYNTVSEAGFEAKEAYDRIFEETQDKQKASEAAARVFRANSVALLLSNAVQASFMHGSGAQKIKQIREGIRNGKGIKETVSLRKDMLKATLEGVASEGFWEENIQSAVQQYEDRKLKYPDLNYGEDIVYGMLLNAANVAKAILPGMEAAPAGHRADEAGGAIVLGALMGSIMGVGSTALEYKKTKDAADYEKRNWARIKLSNALGKKYFIDNSTVGLKTFGTREEIGEDGKPTGKIHPNFINPETGETEFDLDTMVGMVARRLNGTGVLVGQADGLLLGNKHMEKYNRDQALMMYAWNLRNSQGLTEEDIEDILKYDIELPVKNEFKGAVDENTLKENVQKIRNYLKLFNETEEKIAGMYSFTDNQEDADFAEILRRAYFYDAALLEYVKETHAGMREGHSKENAADAIRSIEAHLEGFKSSIPEYRKAYDKEIAPIREAAARKVEIEEKIKGGKETAETTAALRKELDVINYRLKEALGVDAYYHEEFFDRKAEYASASLSRSEPALHRNRRGQQRRPLSIKEKLNTFRGRSALLEMEVNNDLDEGASVNTVLAKLAARPDAAVTVATRNRIKSAAVTEAAALKASSKTPRLTALKQLFDKELLVTQDVKTFGESNDYVTFVEENAGALAEAAALVYGPQVDMNEIYTNPQAFLELYKELDALNKDEQQKLAMADSLVERANNLEKASTEMFDEMFRLGSLTGTAREDAMKETFFLEQTLDIANMVDLAAKQGNEFSQLVGPKLATIAEFKELFTNRDDITEELRERILEKLDEWEKALIAAKEIADKNRAKRYEVQKLSEVAYAESLQEVLKDQDIFDALREILGAELDNILQIISDYDKKENAHEGYEVLFEFIRTKATEEQKKELRNKIQATAKAIGLEFFDKILPIYKEATGLTSDKGLNSRVFKAPKNKFASFVTNPIGAAAGLIRTLTVFANKINRQPDGGPLDEWQRYGLDRDFINLYYTLSQNGFAGLTAAERAIVEETMKLVSVGRAIHSMLNIIEGTSDNVELYKYEAQTLEEESKIPTSQQALSFREAVRQLSSPETPGVTAVFGIFGSGKTSMVAKRVLNFLVKKDQRKSKILAFAQSEETSKNIAESVGGTVSSLEEFTRMSPEELAGIEYLVVDEAFTLHSNQIASITTIASANKIKVLFLGDPSQNKSEDTDTLDKSILQAQPLTVILRTNNPAITNFSTTFQYNPNKVEKLTAEATSTLNDRSSTDTGVFITDPTSPAEQQIISLAKRNNGKTKMIIVNNKERKAKYEAELTGVDVKILTPHDSQGTEADEVYLDLQKDGFSATGGLFQSEFEFNSMMATAASRAKEVLIVAPIDGIKISQTIMPNLNDTVEALKQEFNQYAEDYNQSLAAYKHFYEKIMGIKVSKPAKPAKTEETPPHEGGKPEPTPEPERTPRIEEDGDISIEYPQGDNADSIVPGTGYIVRSTKTGRNKEEWVIMAPHYQGGFVVAGVLSSKEIQGDYFTDEQRKRARKRASMFTLSTDRNVRYSKEEMEPYIIRDVVIKEARPMWFNFGGVFSPAVNKTIDSIMAKFFAAQGVPLKGKVTRFLRIYSNPEAQFKGSFTPRKGVPYAVLTGYELPEDNDGNFPNAIHIPLSPPKLKQASKSVEALTKLAVAFDKLANTLGVDHNEFFNSQQFEDMLADFADLHEFDIMNKIVRTSDFDAKIEEFKTKHLVNDEMLSDLYDILTQVYGPRRIYQRFTEEEFEQWKKDNPDKADGATWTLSEDAKKYGVVSYMETNQATGYQKSRKVDKTVLSLNAGPASKAWHDIASANSDIAGYRPRVTKRTYKDKRNNKQIEKETAKSFIGAYESNRAAFHALRDEMERIAAIMKGLIDSIEDPEDLERQVLAAAYEELDRWIHVKHYGSSELDKVIDRLEKLTGTGAWEGNGAIHEAILATIEEVDPETGELVDKVVTPRELIKNKITHPVPYAALKAITDETNYTEGENNGLFHNLHLHRNREVSIDMREQVVDMEDPSFDELGFTTAVTSIEPASVVINFNTGVAVKTPPPAVPVVEPETGEVLSQADAHKEAIEELAALTPFSVEELIDEFTKELGDQDWGPRIQSWLDTELNRKNRGKKRRKDVDPDDFRAGATVFKNTEPGKLQTMEWARKVLKSILPGYDVDNMVQFLDALQMSVFEREDQDILGQVFGAITRFKVNENKRVYDQVVYHEAFHVAWNFLFTDRMKAKAFKAFQALYPHISEDNIVEGLAELYQRYEDRQGKKTTWLGKLIQDIRAFFDVVYKNQLYLERMFFNLDHGKYSGQVTAKVKPGAPDNLSFIKKNFGSRSKYADALYVIKRRITDYLELGTTNSRRPEMSVMDLPMTREEIFDEIFYELEEDLLGARRKVSAYTNKLLKEYNVTSLSALRQLLRDKERLLDQGSLSATEYNKVQDEIDTLELAFEQLEEYEDDVTLFDTLVSKNRETDRYIFDEIVEGLYPSYKASDRYTYEIDTITDTDLAEMTEEDRLALEESDNHEDAAAMTEAFTALRAETVDHSKVNWASKQSLALKDFFSFIYVLMPGTNSEKAKKNGRPEIMNAKVAYKRALQIINELDLNNPDLAQEIAEYRANNYVNRWDHSILKKLEEIVEAVADLRSRKSDNFTILTRTYDLSNRVDYFVLTSSKPDPNIHSYTIDRAMELAEENPGQYTLVKGKNPSLIELYYAAKQVIPITQSAFTDVYTAKESINTLANLQSFMGSLKDSKYLITQKRFNGNNKSLAAITARGNDRHVNNKALIQESLRENFIGDNSLIGEERTLNKIIDALLSNDTKRWAPAVETLMRMLKLDKEFATNNKVLRNSKNAIAAMLKTLVNSRDFPVIEDKFVENGEEKVEVIPDIDAWMAMNSGGINALTNVIGIEDVHPRATSIISATGEKIYKHTLANPIYNLVGKVIKAQDRLAQNKNALEKLPKYLQTIARINPFLISDNGRPLLRIFELFELDGHKDKYGLREFATSFLRMDKKRFFTAQFSSFFLNTMSTRRYHQLFYQQADKPRPIGATVEVLGEEDLDTLADVLLANIEYFENPERASFLKSINKSYSTEKLVNGDLFKEALNNAKDEKGNVDKAIFVDNLKNLFAREAIKLAKTMVEAKADMFGRADMTETLKELIKDEQELIDNLNDYLPEKQQISAITELPDNSSKKQEYQVSVSVLAPYAYAFLMNYYMNGYFMNQLAIVSSQHFQDSKTVIKRMTGAGSPGHIGYIDNDFGTPEQFSAIVIGDPETTSEEIFAQVMKVMYPEVEGREGYADIKTIEDMVAYMEGSKEVEKNLRTLKAFFGSSGIERTDGQVFITPKRLKELQKGYGREFKLANILKPKYFGHRIETVEYEDGRVEEVAVPTYIKPSAVVLSDDLLYDETGKIRPGMEGLAQIRARMENEKIDELVFASAVKVGLPKTRLSLDQFLAGEPTKAVLTLNSADYQIQLNPRAKVDSTTALFTQLTYFLNIYSSSPNLNNVDKADLVYSAIAFLFEKGGREFERAIKNFGSLLQRAFSEKGDELVFANLVEAGISPTSPIFEKKAIIKLASMMERFAINIRLPGGKLVLQSDVKVKNPQTGKELQFIQENNKLVAEVIVPRGMLPADIEAAIEKGDSPFVNPIMMGFRIPSTELHSAVAMKVVGFYDNESKTNMVIAPQLLVALHGSDFDVDSLFIAKRPVAKKEVRVSKLETVEALVDLTNEIETMLASEEIQSHRLYKPLADAFNKIKRGVITDSDKLSINDLNNISTPRVLASIEEDYQRFQRDFGISISRNDYAKLSGLSWLDRKKVDYPISSAERALGKSEEFILNSRKWQIRSADAHALYDMRRILYNLSKDPAVTADFPTISKKLNALMKMYQKEQLLPAETVAKEGDIIGFKKNEDGKYVLDTEYDTEISKKLEELKALEGMLETLEYRKLKKLVSRQYRDLLALKEDYYKATIVETFLDTIADPKNSIRMMRPISKSYLVGSTKKDGKKVYTKESALSVAQKHGKIKDRDLDLSNFNDAFEAFKSVSDMQLMTGIFANIIKVLAYLSRAGTSLDLAYVKGEKTLATTLDTYRKTVRDIKEWERSIIEDDLDAEERLTLEAKIEAKKTALKNIQAEVESVLKSERVKSKDITKDKKPIPAQIDPKDTFMYTVGKARHLIHKQSEFILGTDEQVSIYDVLDALVNIAIDNIKDQELIALQAMAETGNIYGALLSLGLPATDIVTALYTPAVQSMLGVIQNNSKVKLKDLIQNYKKLVETELGQRLRAYAKTDEEAATFTLDALDATEGDNNSLPKAVQDINKGLSGLSLAVLEEMLSDGIYELPIVLSKAGNSIEAVQQLDTLSDVQLAKLRALLKLMSTAAKLGDNLTSASRIMSVLRGMPITFAGIEQVEESVDELGELLENEEDPQVLDQADVLNRKSILDKLGSLSAAFYTHGNVGYKMGALFSANPHLYAALRKMKQLKKAIQDNYPLLSVPVVNYMRKLFTGISGLSSARSQDTLRTELRRYLMTQSIDRDFYKARYEKKFPSRWRKRSGTKTLYGVEAWAAKFVDRVQALKEYDAKMSARNGIEPNFFLDSIYIDNGRIRFNLDVEVDPVIMEDLRKSFEDLAYYVFDDGYLANNRNKTPRISHAYEMSRDKLPEYDLEYNASEFQKDFLFYVALHDGLRFSTNNYSAAIPARMVKKFMKNVEALEVEFKENEDFRDSIGFLVKIELLRENASVLKSYIKSEDNETLAVKIDDKEDQQKYVDETGREMTGPLNGVFVNSEGETIYYDRAFHNPYETPAERSQNKNSLKNRFPEFFSKGYDNDVEVYMRVTNVTEDKIAYISLGKANGTYTAVPNIRNVGNINDNFKPNMPTQLVEDVNVESFRTGKDYRMLKPGDPIRLVRYSDKSRIEPKIVTITSVEEIWDEYGKDKETGKPKKKFRGYKYTVEPIVANEKALTKDQKRNLQEGRIRKVTTIDEVEQAVKDGKVPVVSAVAFMKHLIDKHSKKIDKKILGLMQTQLSHMMKAKYDIPMFLIPKIDGSTVRGAVYSVIQLGKIAVLDSNGKIPNLSTFAQILTHESVHRATLMLSYSAAVNAQTKDNKASFEKTFQQYVDAFGFQEEVNEFQEIFGKSILEFTQGLEDLAAFAREDFKVNSARYKEILGAEYSKLTFVNGNNFPYGISEANELFTEFLSNPAFREYTKHVQITRSSLKTSLYNHILELLANFFGISVKDYKTTLYDVLNDLMESGAYDQLFISSENYGKINLAFERGFIADFVEKSLGLPYNDETKKELAVIMLEHIKSEYRQAYKEEIHPDNYSALTDIINSGIAYSHKMHNTQDKIDAAVSESDTLEADDQRKTYAKKGTTKTYERVTDDVKGWMSRFIRPSNKGGRSLEEYTREMFKNVKPGGRIFTIHGTVTEEEYLAKAQKIQKRGILRGQIIHALLEAQINGDPKGEISARLTEMLDEAGYDPKDFQWVTKSSTARKVMQKADLNTLDANIPADQRDVVKSEVKLAEDILGIAGTIDMLVFHADGTISIKDFKAGYHHFDSTALKTLLYSDQPAATNLIYDDWHNRAKLQVMTYAVLYKIKNPDAQFNSLDILWLPDITALESSRFRNKVDPNTFLPMIYDMLKEQMPEKLEELEKVLGKDRFKKLWDPKEYMTGNTMSVRTQEMRKDGYPVDQQLKQKLSQLRSLILDGLSPSVFNDASYAKTFGPARDKLIADKMREVLELQKKLTDLDITTDTEDISQFQNWLFTSSTTNNPYIQVWDELFMARRDMFNKKVEEKRNKFLSLLEPVKKIYLSQHPGKSTLDALTRGTFNLINGRELFAFAYMPIDEDGNEVKPGSEAPVVDYKLRSNEKEYEALLNDDRFPYITKDNLHYYKNLLEFVNDSYAYFFKDSAGHKALANRPATFRMMNGLQVPISNLELHNGKRSTYDKATKAQKSELFTYERGFMPRIPPLLSEFNITNPRWLDLWKTRNLTFTEEFAFEGYDKKAMAEGLPMKYLGSGLPEMRNNTDLFSLNLEHQFDRFTRAYYWKEHMDDVFAYGQGIRIMLNTQDEAPKRVIDFMKRELDLKLRGRHAGVSKNDRFISKNKYNINVIKILSQIRYMFNYPLLALNYIGGSANAIFTFLLQAKQATQNSILRSVNKKEDFPGINGDEWDYGLKEFIGAMPEVMKVFTEGMKGNVRNSKAYLLAKRFGYFPNSFDWSTAEHGLVTTGNRLFRSNLLFMFYSLPEEFVALLTMVAQLRSMKVQSGSMKGTSIYDMYEMYDAVDENGNKYKDIRWKTDPNTKSPYVRARINISNNPNDPQYEELTELDGKEVRRLYSAYDKTHGGYRQTDKILLDYHIIGQLALQFRRFLPHILRHALASKGYRSNLGYYVMKDGVAQLPPLNVSNKNQTGEEAKIVQMHGDKAPVVEWHSKVMEGRWKVIGNVVLQGMAVSSKMDNKPRDGEAEVSNMEDRRLGKNGYNWDNLDKGQKEALVDSYVTLLILGMGVMAILGAGGDGDDQDPFYRYVMRIFNDTTQMYNPIELLKNVTNWNPVSLSKFNDLQKDSFTVLSSLFYAGTGNEEKAYTRDGRLEGLNALMRDLPIGSIVRKTEDFMTSDMFDKDE